VTSRPELYRGSKLAGLAAVALFAVIAYVVLTANFPSGIGFAGDISITANIGYLMFDMTGQATVDGEGFLAAFEIIDVVLVAALVGALMLARREGGDPLSVEGGEE
jgi:NADH-quinone oxidoreductase subunit J